MERLKQVYYYFRVILILSLFSFPVHADIYTVTVTTDTAPVSGFTNNVFGELRTALSDAAMNPAPGPHIINLNVSGTITLNKPLPAITRNMTIDNTAGPPLTINGASTYPIFFVYGIPGGVSPSFTPTPITVNIIGGQSFTLQNGLAQGGAGGGGGMGAGGAFFLHPGMTLNLTDVNFNGNQAIGGNGTTSASTGGGGLINGTAGDGGGGVAGIGGSGFSNGLPGLVIGAESGGRTEEGGNGGPDGGGGGGGGSNRNAAGGGVGGMDGGTDAHPAAGEGGFGGGGGRGSSNGEGAVGGYGGGGGSGGTTGGAGGFGGGGGTGPTAGGAGGTDGGVPPLGGGDGDTTRGGGGAGFGGAIFAGGTEDGGVASTLTINSTQDQLFMFNNSFVQSGAGANNGSRGGADLFIGAGVTVQFQSPAGVIQTLNGNPLVAGITGQGSISQQGAGNLVMNGANNYSGGTLLGTGNPATSGSISLGSNTAIGTGLLTLNGGTLLSSATYTITNSFTLTAPSFIGGSNNLTLNPTNPLPGPNPPIAELNANLLTFNNTGISVITLGGVPLTGTAGVTKTGSGTLVYSTQKAYTGLTTIQAGTLQAGVANMLPTTNALTMTGGTFSLLTFNQTLGNFSGTAGTVNLGTATLTVGSDNSSSAFGGNIIGTGSLTKIGTGIFTLTGPSTYSGGTTVNAGTLMVDGSLVAPVTVNSGATLGGTGTILGAVINNNGGTVAPGNQNIGTLTTGSFVNAPGGTLGIEFNGVGQTDLLQVTPGLATITGSTVAFTPAAGAYFSGTIYTFLTANGGVVGQFGTVNFTNANLGPLKTQVIYNPNSVQLKILDLFNPNLACLTPSQRNVVQFFNTLPFQAGTDLGEILTILSVLDPCGVNGPFEQISSAETAATYWVLADEMAQTHLANTRRLDVLRHMKKAKKKCEDQESMYAADWAHTGYAAGDMPTSNTTKSNFSNRWGMPEGDVWVRGLGNHLQQNTLPNSRAFSAKNGGLLLGMDFDLSDAWFVGFSGGKVFSNLDWKGNKDKAHLNTALGSVYASWYNDCGLYVDGSVVAGDSNYAVTRHLNFGTLNRRALSNYKGISISPYGGAGYVFDLCGSVDTEVFGNIGYIDIHRKAYVEKGAGVLNLAVKRKQVGFLRSEAGIGLNNLIESDMVSFLIKTKLSYVNKRQTQKGALTAGFVGIPGNFTVSSYTQPKHQAAVGIGVYCQFSTSGFWSLFYDAEFGSNAMMNAGSARIGFLF